jgi:hypothetical protein
LISDGYEINGGVCSAPDARGFGLIIEERKFRRTDLRLSPVGGWGWEFA